MADAARNLHPITMDDKTLDSYSNSIGPTIGIIIGSVAGVCLLFKGGPAIYNWLTAPSMSDAERQQAETAASQARIDANHAERISKKPLLSNAPPVTGGRRTRKRHRKNHSRK
jgi:hypothetical protein